MFASLPFRDLSSISDSEIDTDKASSPSWSPSINRPEVLPNLSEAAQTPISKHLNMFVQTPPGFTPAGTKIDTFCLKEKEEEEEPPWGDVQSGAEEHAEEDDQQIAKKASEIEKHVAKGQKAWGQQTSQSETWKAASWQHSNTTSWRGASRSDANWRGASQEVLNKFQGNWIDASNEQVKYQIKGSTCYKID